MILREPVTDVYEPLMAEALTAYAVDPTYAVAMAAKASKIKRKRVIWQARMEIRESEAEARTECAASGPALCPVRTAEPCGTGSCPFAPSELSGLVPTATRSGSTATRVRPGPDGQHATYNRDAVTHVLAGLAAC
jgi:hypothetical protein